MALFNVIKWDAPANAVAYKFPGDKLKLGSQIFVSESQSCILLRSGKLVGAFGPGRHVLASGNIPLLDKLVNWPFGGDTPFPAEVWFVNRAVKLDIPWQTNAPIPLRDPQFGVLSPLHGQGQFGLAVTDAAKFLLQLVGTLHSFDYETVRLYFKGVVLSKVSDLIASFISERMIPVLQIATYLDELSHLANQTLAADFAEYGLKLTKFRITSLSPDSSSGLKQVTDALAEKAQIDILGISYREKKELEIMEKAAMNQGMPGTMMGAGMAMGMGQQMAQNMNGFGATTECPHCGRSCKGIYTFCPKCGGKIK